MKVEDLMKIVFLAEHGYYDDKVMEIANKNKPKNIDNYELRGNEIIVYHDGWICGYYGQQQTAPTLGEDLLKDFRKEYLKSEFPEIRKLLEIGD